LTEDVQFFIIIVTFCATERHGHTDFEAKVSVDMLQKLIFIYLRFKNFGVSLHYRSLFRQIFQLIPDIFNVFCGQVVMVFLM